MNGEEVKYLRRCIFSAAFGLAAMMALACSLLFDNSLLSWLMILVAGGAVSWMFADNSDGYNRKVWGLVYTFNNPPLTEQKRALEDGEEL